MRKTREININFDWEVKVDIDSMKPCKFNDMIFSNITAYFETTDKPKWIGCDGGFSENTTAKICKVLADYSKNPVPGVKVKKN
uniref:TIGR04076 family protein n=1 Tax=Strongyloides papillosus TaxID=174720 RepID=A0A0N5C3Z1_STREA